MTLSSLAADHSSSLGARSFTVLPAPAETAAELPAAPGAIAAVERGRAGIRAILNGLDDRLLVIAGPCSIHDPEAGLDYAARLAEAARRHSSELLIVMRTYFEKPRTTVGWKGLINDPQLDGSHDVAAGLRTARRFLLDVTALGLPVATEFLEPVSAPYLSDLVSWGAVGARTTESQIHRQLAAGLPLPVGFKNGTDGGIQVAIDACQAAAAAQAYLGMDDDGRAALVSAPGNPDTHVILRGGSAGPNYAASSVLDASGKLAAAGLNPRVIVDASHANSGKSHHRQAEVALELAAQVETAEPASRALAGVMLESFLAGGAQKLDVAAVAAGEAELVYGQSVTDAAWDGRPQSWCWSSWPQPPAAAAWRPAKNAHVI
ncbi:phospho-2-dehydro-3-deoxyheptonate aldolase [Arthrobacter crystallopoietes BAB-32]|uniref:Phospho-2-dehydro-3-deoxyheptonate aldolase n=1 Tax=Arthrobacter crystallopoietes BAB-32 TaxID=1246476 RepID=N1UVW0_9MICC|nr:phospho-2-dehydro-3-deoxyheptonate aldolase [Arthrobacter crystallopoietes BAB-32]